MREQLSAWEQPRNILKKEKHLEIGGFGNGHYEDSCGEYEDDW